MDATGDRRYTRHELLTELSTGLLETSPDGCEVLRGRWNDPCSGQVFNNAGDLDVDHVVPLYHVWSCGAAERNPEMRIRFANDPANLIATDASTNRQKGADGRSTSCRQIRPYCQYALRFERITRQYDLVVPDHEAAAMRELSREVCGSSPGGM